MGRHSPDYQPSSVRLSPNDSIAPPDDPIDPNAPANPPEPQAEPGSPETAPSEPPFFAPDETSDGSAPAETWRSAGEPVL